MMTTSKEYTDGRALRLIDAALALQQAGEVESALQVLLRAREQVPDYAPVHLLIGLAYRDSGQLEEAEMSLRKAIELDPEQAEAIQSLALFLISQRRSPEAVQLLKRHAELVPGDPITLKALVTELLRLGRQEEVEPLVQDAWQRTRDAEAGITYGRYLIRVGQWNRAETVLRDVAEAHPQPRPLIEWAYALVLLERHEDALQVLHRILDIDPSYNRAWRGISGCYLGMEQYEKALEAAESALAIDNCHYRNWLAKANALMRLNHHRDMLEAARAGLACTPADDAEALPVYQELCLREVEGLLGVGQAEEGLARLDQLCVEFPAEERFTHFDVSLLNRLGRAEDALRVLDRADGAGLAMDGNLAPLRYEALHLLGRSDEAKAFVAPMLTEQRERRLDALAGIGISLYGRGRVEASRAIFEQLLEFAPYASRFANNLAFILTGEGKLEQAEQCYAQALEMPDSDAWRHLILVNLGYVYLLQGDYLRADECLRTGVSLVGEEDGAILRVAYWRDDRVRPDDLAHPSQFMPVRVGARANMVTLALAQGQVEEAEALARQMVDEIPDAPWGHKVLGWVLHGKGDLDGARQAWERALERAKDSQEREVLARWIEALLG